MTLLTTKHQEVFTFSRPNYDYDPTTNQPADRSTHPDLRPGSFNPHPFYRPEWSQIFAQLPHLRPSVLYVFGGQSYLCTPEMMDEKLRTTGTGVGGNGGLAAGRVRSVLLEDKGHLLAQEAVDECAEAAAGFFGTELSRWTTDEKKFQERWGRKSKFEKVTVDERWMKEVGPPRVKGVSNDTDGNSQPKKEVEKASKL